MSNDMLEIPRKKPSGRQTPGKKSSTGKVAAIVVVLALAGLVAWKFLPHDEVQQLAAEARQKISDVADSVTSSGGATQGGGQSAAQRASQGGGQNSAQNDGQDASQNGAAAGSGANGPNQVSGSLGDLPTSEAGAGAAGTVDGGGTAGSSVSVRSGVSSNIVQAPDGRFFQEFQATLKTGEGTETGTTKGATHRPDDVDKALAGKTSLDPARLTAEQRASLPTVGQGLSDEGAPEGAGRNDDSVLTSAFIRNLASWLVNSYQPGRGSEQGRTAASFVSANMRYGTALTGLRHSGNDPVRGREAVLNYVYTPGMLDALYRLYEERFMTAMDAAILNRKPPLSSAQAADMFTLYAGQFRQTSAGLKGVAALPDLSGKLGVVRRAGQAVVKANAAFADTLFAFEEARDAGNAKKSDSLRAKLTANTRSTEQAIQSRAAARRTLADAIKLGAGGKTPGEDTLLYMAEWVDRRGAGAAPATTMAADILNRLADRFEVRASW